MKNWIKSGLLGFLIAIVSTIFILHGIYPDLIITNQTINTTISEVSNQTSIITITQENKTNQIIDVITNKISMELDYGEVYAYSGNLSCSGRSCFNDTTEITCRPHLKFDKSILGDNMLLTCIAG